MGVLIIDKSNLKKKPNTGTRSVYPERPHLPEYMNNYPGILHKGDASHWLTKKENTSNIVHVYLLAAITKASYKPIQ